MLFSLIYHLPSYFLINLLANSPSCLFLSIYYLLTNPPGLQLHLINLVTNSTCTHSYPCALWTTFHTLVAHATAHGGDSAGAEALLAIRAYVASFFGCRTCAGHFVTVAENMTTEVAALSTNGPTLWLWQAHNKANVRIGA